MHTSAPGNDSVLLSRYLSEGDESAFAELVRTHEAMVIGAAWRRTGDTELARDVAQQVFATLAQKAWLLAERSSVAGWLHVAATHFATRARRAESARQRRHEQAAVDEQPSRDHAPWATLEDALASLPTAEREALLLHYFEDRSYPDMAAALGLSEPAARKRVSRALEKLGAQLRRRGLHSAAVTLLTGAAAMQTGTVAAAGSSLALATTGTAASSFTLTFSTFMAHTAVKIAAVATLLVAIPIAWQSRSNAALRDDLARLSAPAAATNPALASTAADPTKLHDELRDVTTRLAQVRRNREDATTRLAAAQRDLDRLQKEVVVSFGNTKDLARTVAGKMDDIVRMITLGDELHSGGGPPDPQKLQAAADSMKTLSEILPLMQRIRELDNHPAQASTFYTTLLGDTLQLSPDVQTQLQAELQRSYEKLKSDGLTVAFRPRENPKEWIARREVANQAVTQRVFALLTPEQRTHPFFKINGPTGGILFPEAGHGPFGMTPTYESRNATMKAAPKQTEPPRPNP
jgi:RNA polymerase sigma factor (sigma-70 family)